MYLFWYCIVHDPYVAANRSVYAGFQHSPVISSFLAGSNENFQRGSRVPSLSRNSSDASSQYLKSKILKMCTF